MEIARGVTTILVVDGQGGGIGAQLVSGLRAAFGEGVDIVALGTNAIATSTMLKAGANKGATGENAIRVNAATADIIAGSIGILVADSMLGEMTGPAANAIGAAKAPKFLLPTTNSPVHVAGVAKEPLPHAVDRLVAMVREYIHKQS